MGLKAHTDGRVAMKSRPSERVIYRNIPSVKLTLVTIESAKQLPVLKSKPYLLLDILRGLTALWVVSYHSCLPYLTGSDQVTQQKKIYWVSLHGQLGVVIFFVISGYCITAAAYSLILKQGKITQFCSARVHRIYPPYFFTCLMAIVMDFLINWLGVHHLIPMRNHVSYHVSGPAFWVANFSMTQFELHQDFLVNVFWSLCYEIFFYFMVALLLLITMKMLRLRSIETKSRVFALGIGALTLTSLLWLIFNPQTCLFPFNLWYQFGLGGLLFFSIDKAFRQVHSAKWVPVLLVSSMVASIALATIHSDDGAYGHPSTSAQAITSVLLVLGLAFLYKFDHKISTYKSAKPLFFLGSFSYSLYLVHRLILPIANIIGRRMGIDHAAYPLNMLIQISLGVLAGWIFYFLCERHFISSNRQKYIQAEQRS